MSTNPRLEEVMERIDLGLPRDPYANSLIDYTPRSRPVAPPSVAPTQMQVAAEAAAGIAMPAGVTSIPVWTVEVCGVLFCIIHVDVPGCRTQYQTYAIAQDRTWTMVALTGLYMDSVAEIQSWRGYLTAGGSLSQWQKAHPDGIQPLLS